MAKGTKSLSLQRFAGAKKSKYDKRGKAEKKAARRAKIIHKYGKLKARLKHQGKLENSSQQLQEPSRSEHEEGGVKSQEVLGVLRAQARAGPAPDDDADEEAVGTVLDGSEPQQHHLTNTIESTEQLVSAETRDNSGAAAQENEGKLQGGVEVAQQKGKKQQKPRSQIQLLGDKAADRNQKLEVWKQREAHNKEVAKTEKLRRKERKKLLQKTKTGQPVMKHRIDKILNQLERPMP